MDHNKGGQKNNKTPCSEAEAGEFYPSFEVNDGSGISNIQIAISLISRYKSIFISLGNTCD